MVSEFLGHEGQCLGGFAPVARSTMSDDAAWPTVAGAPSRATRRRRSISSDVLPSELLGLMDADGEQVSGVRAVGSLAMS